MAPSNGLEVADIVRRFGPAFRETNHGKLSRAHLRTLGAIETCRTAALGGHTYECAECGARKIVYNSCRNRHCPKCQSLEKERWLQERCAELLPVPYFHVVFTLPEELLEHRHREKEVRPAADPPIAIDGESTAGHDAVQVGVEGQLLAPGVEHGQDADASPQVLGIGGDLQQGFGAGLKEQLIDNLLIVERQPRKFVRQGEDHRVLASATMANKMLAEK